MVINFQANNPENSSRLDTAYGDRAKYVKTSQENVGSRRLANAAGGVDYQKGSRFAGNMVVREKEKGKSLADIREDAGNMNVAALQDYMTVMSNTMSEEDYAELEKEGFHFRSLKPEEAVTIVDKIKSEMAKSGTVVAGYNDDLDVDTLAKAVGSETLARAVAESFRQADLPLTEENIRDVAYAWELAGRLTEPTDGSLSYMIDQELEPRIEDFYLAQNSGMDGGAKGAQSYFRQEFGGYMAQESVGSTADMQEQIDKVIENAGLEINEWSREKAAWLLDRGLELIPENLVKLKEFEECTFPVPEQTFAKAVSGAVAEGKKAVQADLTAGESVYEKAGRLLSYYAQDSNFEDLKENLTARRQLEEIRLRMTAEVNVKLLKSNFAIDTAPMEELVSALRKAEEEIAESYFPKDADAVEKYHLLNDAQKAVNDLPSLPAGILGMNGARSMDLSLEEFHREGTVLKDTYVRANESYEALMTAPRKDLGDSIKKAFANVDDIVRDLGMAVTDENRRAVRILGYNRMEINAENVEKVRAADEEVQGLIRRLTPAATLKMIRDGVNPLEKSMDELNTYLDSQEDSFENQAESYSRFLYRLERNKEITESERETYIGIYRLVRQIEKSDGAAVGALVNSQAELQFSNLLSAVRSRKFKGLDVRIEDAFGTVSERVRDGRSISDQILSAFRGRMDEVLEEISYSEESQRAWYEEELAQLKNAAGVGEDAVLLLQKGEAAESAENLLAANALLHGEEALFEGFLKNVRKSQKTVKTEKMEALEHLWEKTGDKETFVSEYDQMLEDMEKETENAAFEAEGSVDVRQLSLLHKQISIARQVSESEEYFIPMYVGERLAQVHLSVEHSGGGKGTVDISLDSESGEIHAQFTVTDGRLDGFFTGNGEEEVTNLKKAADIVSSRITEGEKGLERIRMGQIHVALASVSHTGTLPAQGTDARLNETDGADNRELYRIAKLFLEQAYAG